MQASAYQEAVYDHFARRGGNAAVISVAGSGKTTTAIKGIGRIPVSNRILLGAFNTSIRDEFRTRCEKAGYRHVVCTNYNGFGYRVLMQNMIIPPELDPDKTVHVLEFDILKPQNDDELARLNLFRGPVARLVSLAKNHNVQGRDEAWAAWPGLIDHHDMDVPDDPLFLQVVQATFEKCVEVETFIDFDDQKYLPILHNWRIPKYDVVILDEFQDTCPLEMELMSRAAQEMYVFGDPDQAIYGFKGATPDAFPLFKTQMNATELPLSICYRCPISVVQEAQHIVPRIEAAPGAIAGSVAWSTNRELFEKIQDGDFILCRTTDDLVSTCIKLIRRGRKAFVRGRDFARGLDYLINKASDYDDNMKVDVFITKLLDYQMHRGEQLTRLRREGELLRLQDRCNTIRALADNAKTVGDIKKNGLLIFTDQPHNGIDLMTIHKSKGLQAKNVWILRPDLLPHPRSIEIPWMLAEEMRLKYVAITRATENLRWVRFGKIGDNV